MVIKFWWKVLGFIALLVVAELIVVGICFMLWGTSSNTPPYDTLSPLPPSNSTLGVFSQAAVVSVGGPCAGFGRDMLSKGGSAVDAAIATLLCEGVCVMQSMGTGGGFLMTIYDKKSNKTYSLVARETAPAAATRDMYVNHSDWAQFGALSAGVPGELKGYQEAWKKFGHLEWKELFQPTIELCENGVPVNKRMADHFISEEALIRNSSTFVNVILNSTNGRLPVEGELIKLPRLAQTLRVIADSPIMADELYNGSLTKMFVADIQAGGGIITEEDMNNYQVRWEETYNASLSDGLTLHSSALPGSGILVAFILRLLDGLLQFGYSDLQRSQMIVEAFKHAYGRRSHLGDPHFVNATLLNETIRMLTSNEAILETRSKIKTNWTDNNYTYYGGDYWKDDHGTDNIVVLSPNGSAVSVTSTLNLIFGSKFVSTSTGILLNDQMDDFSTPGIINYFHINPSEANFIQPGKRPLSSMSPTIVVDRHGDVRLVVGGAGGSKITTQTSLVSIRNLWLGKNIKEAIDLPRFHHQLLPMNITYEYGILQEMVEGWHAIGHSTVRVPKNDFMAVITGIARIGGNVTANCDWRKPGSVAGF